MKKLSKPLQNTKPEDIFEECVSSYRDKKKVTCLMKCKGLVQSDAVLYDKVVPSELDKFTPSSLPSGVSDDDLVDVYTNKFAAAKSPGRKYYNKIRDHIALGICPICGIRTIKTLDHYLPKSKFPTLSVTPSNLIPSCRDCNMDKLDASSNDPQNTPIHLYFDDVPNEPWLHVTVGDNLEILYYVSCPDTWDVGIRNRLAKHLDIYKLHKLYSSQASNDIANSIFMWRKTLCQSSDETLRLSLMDACESAEYNDMNSWKAALYRGLVANFDKVKEYILSQFLDE